MPDILDDEHMVEEGGPSLAKSTYIIEEDLPDWAARYARPKTIEPMLQLCTRDGTRSGNATVVRVIRVDLDEADCPNPLFEIVTDANSWSRLSTGEILELYTLGKYILKEFPNPKSYERDPE